MNRIPATMKAVQTRQPGGVEMLEIAERPVPEPGPGEVLIENHASSVNRLDTYQREGNYPIPPGVTDILGLDCAGRIVAVGKGVTGWSVGDDVCALLGGGGYAEYCVAPAGSCLPVPRGLSYVQAATLPEVAFTVWTNVFDRGRLKAGERFLVHGGSSGIGTMAIQMAVQLGSETFATAGGGDKCAVCVELGARRAIDYRSEDFVKVIMDTTRGEGVDVVLDVVGGDYVQRNIDCLAVEGRLAQIALLGGPRVEIDYGLVIRKRLTLTGSTLRARPAEFKSAIAQRLRAKVWPLIEAGRIAPMIRSVFPLERVGEAHTLLVSGTNIGKIGISIRS